MQDFGIAEPDRTALVPRSSLANDVAQIAGITFTPVSLEFSEDFSLAEWQEAVEQISFVERGSQWWLGDAIVLGGRRYGQTYRDALKLTSYSPGHLRNVASVARRVRPAQRRSDLAWSVHQVVAALTPAAQDKWLAYAAGKRMSAAELTDTLRRNGQRPGRQRARTKPPALKPGTPCPTCGRPR